jgi:hypothetical protein
MHPAESHGLIQYSHYFRLPALHPKVMKRNVFVTQLLSNFEASFMILIDLVVRNPSDVHVPTCYDGMSYFHYFQVRQLSKIRSR